MKTVLAEIQELESKIAGVDPWKKKRELAEKIKGIADSVAGLSISESRYSYGEESKYESSVNKAIKEIEEATEKFKSEISKSINSF